jgi:hypothetical protein
LPTFGRSSAADLRRSSPECLDEVFKSQPEYRDKLKKFEDYVAGPLDNTNDIPKEKCGDWVSDRLVNLEKHYQVGDNCYAYALAG